MQAVHDENAVVGARTRNSKVFTADTAAAPKERRALGAISGNVVNQPVADKPAKRRSRAVTKSKPAGEEVAKSTHLAKLSEDIGDIKFDDIIDSGTRDDPQEVAGYIDDIIDWYRKTEMKGLARAGYMSEQEDINEKMREILIDWIVEVHMKFQLMPCTLYLTVQIIDRYLSREQVSRSKLQLVGITSMLIASKFEEIYPPEVRDFVYISDKAYTNDEIIVMERAILNALKFEITFPTVHSFGKRFAKVAHLDERTENVAFYLIDMTLQEYHMLKYSPSTISAAGVNLAERIAKQLHMETPVWSPAVAKYIGFHESALEACMRDMHALLCSSAVREEKKLKAVKKKYSNEKYLSVAKTLSPMSEMADSSPAHA